jgi:hypothetical protein
MFISKFIVLILNVNEVKIEMFDTREQTLKQSGQIFFENAHKFNSYKI